MAAQLKCIEKKRLVASPLLNLLREKGGCPRLIQPSFYSLKKKLVFISVPVQVAAGVGGGDGKGGDGGDGGDGGGDGGGGDGGGASVVVHAGRSPANSHTNGLYTELSVSSMVTVQRSAFQTTVGVKLPSRVALPSAKSWLVSVP